MSEETIPKPQLVSAEKFPQLSKAEGEFRTSHPDFSITHLIEKTMERHEWNNPETEPHVLSLKHYEESPVVSGEIETCLIEGLYALDTVDRTRQEFHTEKDQLLKEKVDWEFAVDQAKKIPPERNEMIEQRITSLQRDVQDLTRLLTQDLSAREILVYFSQRRGLERELFTSLEDYVQLYEPSGVTQRVKSVIQRVSGPDKAVALKEDSQLARMKLIDGEYRRVLDRLNGIGGATQDMEGNLVRQQQQLSQEGKIESQHGPEETESEYLRGTIELAKRSAEDSVILERVSAFTKANPDISQAINSYRMPQELRSRGYTSIYRNGVDCDLIFTKIEKQLDVDGKITELGDTLFTYRFEQAVQKTQRRLERAFTAYAQKASILDQKDRFMLGGNEATYFPHLTVESLAILEEISQETQCLEEEIKGCSQKLPVQVEMVEPVAIIGKGWENLRIVNSVGEMAKLFEESNIALNKKLHEGVVVSHTAAIPTMKLILGRGMVLSRAEQDRVFGKSAYTTKGIKSKVGQIEYFDISTKTNGIYDEFATESGVAVFLPLGDFLARNCQVAEADGLHLFSPDYRFTDIHRSGMGINLSEHQHLFLVVERSKKEWLIDYLKSIEFQTQLRDERVSLAWREQFGDLSEEAIQKWYKGHVVEIEKVDNAGVDTAVAQIKNKLESKPLKRGALILSGEKGQTPSSRGELNLPLYRYAVNFENVKEVG
ncbi:MAG TPA: hypothetical protein VMW29_02625 [Candidatus Bathyarchaeia archaeon]|nr:hypothetical protein [Candidatus Bathyarchaeia archaeon]